MNKDAGQQTKRMVNPCYLCNLASLRLRNYLTIDTETRIFIWMEPLLPV
jgi:hypothetical protein